MNKLFILKKSFTIGKLCLCSIFMLLSFTSMSDTFHPTQPEDIIQPQLYNVANIVLPNVKSDYYTITFYQSARFYKLYRNNKNCKSALSLLKNAKKNDAPVLIFLTENFGDVIADVKKHKN